MEQKLLFCFKGGWKWVGLVALSRCKFICIKCVFLENYNRYNHRPYWWVGGKRAMETPTNCTDEDNERQQGHVDDVHHSWGHFQGSILPSTALVENIGFQTHCLLFFWDGIFTWNFAVPVLPRMIVIERNCNKHNAAVFKPSWWWSCTYNCPTARANKIESPQPSHWLSQMLHAWIVSKLTFGANFKSRVVLRLGCWVHFKRLCII